MRLEMPRALGNIVIVLADDDPGARTPGQSAAAPFGIRDFECLLVGMRRLARDRQKHEMMDVFLGVANP